MSFSLRTLIFLLLAVCFGFPSGAKSARTVVVDSVTSVPLPRATVYDRFGNPIGMSDKKGRVPYFPENYYPLTVRYMGFEDCVIPNAFNDTVFMKEDFRELPELVVDRNNCKILHILAYVREYSTMTTYTDTVFLFREKMVDFMLNADQKSKFKGWSKPRVLASQSYYRFTDNKGLDSVSDVSNHHFSWSDWVGVMPSLALPGSLRNTENGQKIVYGKYSPAEKWQRSNDRISVSIDVLADTLSRKWVPGLYGFFHRAEGLERFIDFESIRLRCEYENVTRDELTPENLVFYSYDIESAGRGHSMFRFNKVDQQFFVSTNADVYILDKEYINLKEATKWEKREIDVDDRTIYTPLEAPELCGSIEDLIDRVGNMDKEKVRLDTPPDFKLVGADLSRKNFKIGRRLLYMLKALTGITAYKAKKKRENDWKAFRNERKRINSLRPVD